MTRTSKCKQVLQGSSPKGRQSETRQQGILVLTPVPKDFDVGWPRKCNCVLEGSWAKCLQIETTQQGSRRLAVLGTTKLRTDSRQGPPVLTPFRKNGDVVMPKRCLRVRPKESVVGFRGNQTLNRCRARSLEIDALSKGRRSGIAYDV